MPHVPTDLTSFLREARGRAKKTQRAVAKELEVSVQAVSQWETGERRPPLKKLSEIAATYAIDLGQLQDFLHAAPEARDGIENGFGVRVIERVLEAVTAAAPTDGEPRAIIHSYSTRGFLTGENPTLARVVLGCAAVGVDVVFFSFSPASIEDPELGEVQKALQKRFRGAEQLIRSSGEELDMQEAKNIFGAFRRFVAVTQALQVQYLVACFDY